MVSIADQLHTLGALMKTNLERKGVTGLTTSMGLTTLANKILDIDCQGGGGDGLYLSGSSSIIQIDETCTLNAVLLSNNKPVENEVVVLYSNKDSPITTGMDATNFELKFGSVDAQVLFNDIIPNRVLVDYEASNNLITIWYSNERDPFEAMRGTVLYKVGNTFFTDWGYSITVPSSLNILNVYGMRGIQANDFTSIIGGGFTNVGGVVTADYVGTGAGDVIVYAKCNLNGSFLQETFVEDTYRYDKCNLDNISKYAFNPIVMYGNSQQTIVFDSTEQAYKVDASSLPNSGSYYILPLINHDSNQKIKISADMKSNGTNIDDAGFVLSDNVNYKSNSVYFRGITGTKRYTRATSYTTWNHIYNQSSSRIQNIYLTHEIIIDGLNFEYIVKKQDGTVVWDYSNTFDSDLEGKTLGIQTGWNSGHIWIQNIKVKQL